MQLFKIKTKSKKVSNPKRVYIKRTYEHDRINRPQIAKQLRTLLEPGDQVFIFNCPTYGKITCVWNYLKKSKDKELYQAKIIYERFVSFSTKDEIKVAGYLVTRI